MTDLAAVRAALRPNTRLVWTETPSNPTIAVTDLRARRRRSRGRRAPSPPATTPGPRRSCSGRSTSASTSSMHSTTKYLSGHSDVMGGVVVTRESGAARASASARSRRTAAPCLRRSTAGSSCAGIRTLPWRMRAHCANAQAVAAFLSAHPRRGARPLPGPADATRGTRWPPTQMAAPGGMLSFVVPGGRARAFEVAARLRLFTRATSLGGPESLVEHRASIEGAKTRAPEGLLRALHRPRASGRPRGRPGRRRSRMIAADLALAPCPSRPGATPARRCTCGCRSRARSAWPRRRWSTTPGTPRSTSPPRGPDHLAHSARRRGRSRSPSTSSPTSSASRASDGAHRRACRSSRSRWRRSTAGSWSELRRSASP